MSMTLRAARLLTLVLLAALAAGCATSGRSPRPKPFPGAPLPPTTEPSPELERPAAGGLPLLATALALRGAPYVNGGSDPVRGFDCSGFVQWVFARHGLTLPRETRAQYKMGVSIHRDRVEPGDLVFFETVSRGASHVGIALGRGEFVHAPSSRGVVRVEQYATGYWRERWVGARRVTDDTAAASD